jgi:uncharacterized protein YjbI with pentapeptide repeats
MANPEHLEILRLGIEQWNRWRKEHPDVRPDLSVTDLSNANLGEADLRGAYLRSVELGGADLTRALLSGVDLAYARLHGAKLNLQDLHDASLFGAELPGANLNSAYLNGADLRWAKLRGARVVAADLCRVNLSEAQLSEADLSLTKLCEAKLRSADLRGANLSRADLTEADLTLSNLSRADMRRADLRQANIAGANLTEVNFAQAIANGTHFAGADLSVAKGLESVEHQGPSTIGIDTIFKSRGKIPDVFLRGCGLQDWEIELVKLYQPDLAAVELTAVLDRVSELRSGAPLRYPSCFISYSTKNQEFAERLYNDLQGNGVRCWFAPHDIQGGRKIHEQLDEAIRLHDKLLLILSEHSMNSPWVKTEIANARKREEREKKQMLFPITLAPYADVKRWELFDADRGIDSAREIREYFIPDFSNWKEHDSYQKAFQRLVKDLKAGSKSAAG